MDENKAKRRSWIKNIAIIFLVILLVLTFFSNTIMNYSLPQVAVQYAESGTITTRISGTGTVEANQNYELKMPETRVIADIGIKSGSKITEGDVIFRLEAGEAPDLTNAEKELTNARIAYESALMDLPDDFTTQLQAVERAKEALDKAKAQSGESYGFTAEELEDKNDELTDEKNYEQSQITVYTKQLSSNTSVDNTYLYRELDDAQLAFETDDAKSTAVYLKNLIYDAETEQASLEAQAEDLIEQKADIQARYDKLVKKAGSELDDDNPLKSDYRTLEDKLTAHENLRVQKDRELEDARSALSDKYSKYAEAMQKMTEAQSKYLAGEMTKEQYEAAVEAMKTAADAYNKQQTSYNRTVEDIEASIKASELGITRFREDLAEKEAALAESGAYRDEINALSAELDRLTESIDAVQKAKKDADKRLEAANENYTDANDKYLLMAITACERRVKALDKQINENKEIISDINAGEDSEEKIREAERAYEAALNNYKRAKEQASNDQKIAEMKLEQQKKELERLEAKYEELKGGGGETEIKAPVSGIVSSVNVSIGDEVSMNTVIANIQLVDRGYNVSFNVTEDQAKRINVGDVAEVQYYWGSNDLTARVESVTSIQGNNTSKKVTLNVNGSDVSLGRSMTFILGQRSQSYDTVIPKNALHEDTNGNFVLVVTAKSTPLGTRYTASRKDVTVLASDDNNVAIQGVFNYSEYIITTSNSPITNGMQVRLQEK